MELSRRLHGNARPRFSASYRSLASYAGSKGLYVLIENHGGVGSEHPEDLVRIYSIEAEFCGDSYVSVRRLLDELSGAL